MFDPVRHARPDHAGGREPTPVEPPVSEAAEWSAGQVARRETALLEHLAGRGMTMAGYLAEQGLDPGLPFDRVVAAMVRRELPARVERQDLPDWWAELVGRYPELAQAQYRLPEFDDEWAPERRGELAHALATRLRAEEVLNPDRRATFTAQIRAYSPRAGGTYRGWRWEEPHHAGGPTFGVDRQVVCGDTMSGAVLVTGIVTVLGAEGRKFLVRDAEPAEAARLRCAEATWAAPPHLLPPG
ncbi:hypothetical protein AB0C18_38185 [Nonomuraea muscovyensis]|uniref:hypothetical protein n=2 Tax=Nonomuraea muscovyensis TaxID=1124761 RepID=UPI00340FD7AB